MPYCCVDGHQDLPLTVTKLRLWPSQKGIGFAGHRVAGLLLPADYAQSLKPVGASGHRMRQQGQSVRHHSVDDSRRARHVADITNTTAGIHGHGRYVAGSKYRRWLAGPASDLPALVSVRRLPDDVVRTGGVLCGGAQDSVGRVWPALGEGSRANIVLGTRCQERGHVLAARPRLGPAEETRAAQVP